MYRVAELIPINSVRIIDTIIVPKEKYEYNYITPCNSHFKSIFFLEETEITTPLGGKIILKPVGIEEFRVDPYKYILNPTPPTTTSIKNHNFKILFTLDLLEHWKEYWEDV